MNPSASHTAGLSLRHAALIAGIAYILNPVTYAETVYPHLVIHGNIAQTVQNIAARPGTFAVIIFSYLISFIGDIVIAWALYVLLAPVNRALSLLTALFQLVYAAVALDGVMHLLTVFNLITTPELRATFTDAALQSQVATLLSFFRSTFSVSLILFGIHLVLLGYLVFRSTYMPRWLGVLLVIDGTGWLIDSASPYFYPHLPLTYLPAVFLGELALLLWLLIRGWKIREPVPAIFQSHVF